jgi:hypothetical protein
VSDEAPLNVPSAVEIQMQIYGGGLDVVMSQVVLDVCDGIAAIEHIHCS